MHKNRLEAFSDGVIAIIITIMVLELKVPHSGDFESLFSLWPIFLSYILSFFYLAIYWNNHHHLIQAVSHINGSILWTNMFLLFWLSLVPFVTAWSGENHFAELPVAIYGFVLLMAAVSYYFLVQALLRAHPKDSALVKAIGNDFKGKISLVIYLFAIPVAFFLPVLSLALFAGVALIWVIPDKRIENVLS